MQKLQFKWPKTPLENIIVKMPNWIGDVVMATPVLQDLKNHFKHVKLTAMCQSNIAPILKDDPNIDELYSYQKPNGWIHKANPIEIVEKLRRGQYDLGVLLTNSFSSAWWFFQGEVKNRLGYVGTFRNFLLNQAVPIPKNVENQHLIITYQMLLAPLGIPVTNTLPKLYVEDEEEASSLQTLIKLGADPSKYQLIGFNPGAAFGSAKCWLPERFKAINDRLLQNPNLYLIYFGDQAGISLVDEVCKGAEKRILNLAGKTTLRTLIAMIKHCSLFVTNDSGPMHIASALGVKLVALFGSTSDIKTGPFGHSKVIHKHVECSPCYKRVCPIDFRCMTRISVEEVYHEIQKMLKD